MRLSELKTGESATILKVCGHGGFRRRIMEMGFVRGQRVKVELNAPLRDPIEYKIMGYEISLRRSAWLPAGTSGFARRTPMRPIRSATPRSTTC